VTNVDYWKKKIARNVERDAETLDKLNAEGWLSMTIWECELKIVDRPRLTKRIEKFLSA